jgi:peptide/nickel transport system permease protein
MLAYMARRLGLAVFTIWIITLFGFLVIQLPEGDAIDRYLDLLELGGGGEHMNSEKIAQNLRAYAGYDQPMPVRYGKWMWNMMHGDLGRSFLWYQGDFPQETPVKELVGDRIWTTVTLSAFTILVTWTLAIPIGIYSAVRQHTIGDYVFTLIGFSGLAVPDFLLGLVLMYVAFAYFDQSVGGLNSPDFQDERWDAARLYDLLKHLWIPAVVLGTSGTASLIRIMRNNLLDELGKQYVVTARAKGVPPWKVILKYPVRVAINPLVSTVGYLLPSLISGSIIVSVVLSLPTLGPLLLEAIQKEDVGLGGFIILVAGVLTVLGTLVSDILLAVVDPRIRLTNQ